MEAEEPVVRCKECMGPIWRPYLNAPTARGAKGFIWVWRHLREEDTELCGPIAAGPEVR